MGHTIYPVPRPVPGLPYLSMHVAHAVLCCLWFTVAAAFSPTLVHTGKQFLRSHEFKPWHCSAREKTYGTASKIPSSVSDPSRYTRTAFLTAPSKRDALDEWLNFVWDTNAGLPIPPPISVSGSHSDGCGRTVWRMTLKESIVSLDLEECQVRYTVLNPGLPLYPADSTNGRVRFYDTDSEGVVQMVWEVENRPCHGWDAFMKGLTETLVNSITSNFKVHLAEPDAVVPLQAFGVTLTHLAKRTWLAHVLEASYTDQRPIGERMLSMLKPWTWALALDAADTADWSDVDSEDVIA